MSLLDLCSSTALNIVSFAAMETERQSSVELEEKVSPQLPSRFYFAFFSMSALALAAALSTTSLSISLQVRCCS
jgi:hypothetical protein